MDKNLPQQYKHEAIVAVNFESAEYLYNFINNKKVKDSKITKVTIVPVFDVFQLISDNEDHLRALTFLSDSGLEIAEYKKGSSNIFFYRYHLLLFFFTVLEVFLTIFPEDFFSFISSEPTFLLFLASAITLPIS